jgi:hypothetical protein
MADPTAAANSSAQIKVCPERRSSEQRATNSRSFEKHAHNGLANRGQVRGVPLSSGAATGGLCACIDSVPDNCSQLYSQQPASTAGGRAFPPSLSAVTSAEMESSYFQAYCVTCHRGAAAPAGLRLDKLDMAHVELDAATWEKVVWKVRSGMMPPSGMPQPDARTLESMMVWMESELDRHAPGTLPAHGVHRLNRTEYANAIRDLLDVEVDASRYLRPTIRHADSIMLRQRFRYRRRCSKATRPRRERSAGWRSGTRPARYKLYTGSLKTPRRITTSKACRSERAAA